MMYKESTLKRIWVNQVALFFQFCGQYFRIDIYIIQPDIILPVTFGHKVNLEIIGANKWGDINIYMFPLAGNWRVANGR